MVARGAGAVGCAHCKMIGADRACQVCTRLVCGKCFGDWATCEEPSGRVVRLGLTARVRDIDPTGRLALVSHWRRGLRLFDLRQLRWVKDIRFPRGLYVGNRRYPPRLTGDGRLVHGEWTLTTANEPYAFLGMRAVELGSNRSRLIASEMPGHGTAVTAAADHFYYVTDTQLVALIPGPTSSDTQRAARLIGSDVGYALEPLPRKVLHAVHVDGERDLLAAGSWSEVVLHRIVDGKLEKLSHAATEQNGNVVWIAVAGPWLVAAISQFGDNVHVEVRRLERDQSIGPVEHRHGGALASASLSRDGRYLALAFGTELLVHELGASSWERFTEHTDAINIVRFAGEDHVLISADTDNRVVMRPRTPQGYAKPLIAIDIPDDGVPLTLPTPIELAR